MVALRTVNIPLYNPPTEPNEQPRLLIVDDDVSTAQALQMYFIHQGYKVKAVYSGQRALEEIPRFHPHLLIVDLLMPDMNGFEVTMRVRSDPKLSYIPVIVITAQDEERKRLQSRLSGADDYIAKPVNQLELLVRVQALLRTKHQLDKLLAENRTLLADLEARNRELEEALLAVHEANILKQNILETISHEMNTPMLQIKASTQLLVEDVLKTDPDSKAAQFVQKSVGRLQGVINNVVDLAQSDNIKNDLFLAKEAVDLALRRIEKSWDDKLSVNRIQTQIPPNLPPVYADRRAVSRVLIILLDNALKFDPKGKAVEMRAELTADGKNVCFSVRDHGIGIPEDQRERIFWEFYQVDSSTTKHFGGMGVGLALAKLLCGRMKTQIKVESTIGVGSTFSFILPVADLSR